MCKGKDVFKSLLVFVGLCVRFELKLLEVGVLCVLSDGVRRGRLELCEVCGVSKDVMRWVLVGLVERGFLVDGLESGGDGGVGRIVYGLGERGEDFVSRVRSMV